MIHSVISALLPDILNLSFADKVGGIVYPMQKQIKTTKDDFITKTFPVYGNDPTVCLDQPYIDMVPDSDLKSVIYFESQPEMITESGCNAAIISDTQITLVAWFNLGKINKTLTTGEGMLRIIATVLNGTHDLVINGMNVHTVFTLTNIDFRNPAIFGKYDATYKEANKQYLIYPRDFGALNYDVQLSYGLCDEEPEIDPVC